MNMVKKFDPVALKVLIGWIECSGLDISDAHFENFVARSTKEAAVFLF